MRRVSKRERFQESVTALDAFPKIEPEAQERTSSGAITTLLTTAVILGLIVSEFYYYKTVDITYDYTVDLDMRRDMNMTLDITVAMSCTHVGADYIDVSGSSSDMTNFLQLQPAHFALTDNQLAWLEDVDAHRLLGTLHDGSTEDLDSLQRFLYAPLRDPMPVPVPPLTTPPDACRLHGTMPINKVAANFHITAGKSIHHARGHSHMSNTVPEHALNFSHRIDRLSFSELREKELHGVHTLDGELQTTNERFETFQYFLKVVPTTTQRLQQPVPFRSNQYSVHEQRRKSYGNNGGMPGIFMKLELEAIGVNVKEKRRSFSQFMIRLCGIIGGIFATSGMLHQAISAAWTQRAASAADAPLSPQIAK